MNLDLKQYILLAVISAIAVGGILRVIDWAWPRATYIVMCLQTDDGDRECGRLIEVAK